LTGPFRAWRRRDARCWALSSADNVGHDSHGALPPSAARNGTRAPPFSRSAARPAKRNTQVAMRPPRTPRNNKTVHQRARIRREVSMSAAPDMRSHKVAAADTRGWSPTVQRRGTSSRLRRGFKSIGSRQTRLTAGLLLRFRDPSIGGTRGTTQIGYGPCSRRTTHLGIAKL
jgi:hypothetical protein